MGAWIDYLTGIVIGVFSLLCVFEASRQLVLQGVHKAAVQMLLGGLFLSFILGGVAYFAHHMTANVIQTLNEPVVVKHLPLPDRWGDKCCKGTREIESRKLVQAAFVESGRFFEYLDSSGKRLPFTPSESDVKEREERVVSNARLADVSQARLSEAINILISTILAMLFGAGFGYEQRKASANTKAETDARKNSARGSP